MPNFVFTYRGGSMPESQADRDAAMAAWGEWFGGLGAAVVDGGTPFGASATVTSDGRVHETAASNLTGYTIVAANDLKSAIVIAESCPLLKVDGGVDVYETVAM